MEDGILTIERFEAALETFLSENNGSDEDFNPLAALAYEKEDDTGISIDASEVIAWGFETLSYLKNGQQLGLYN